MPLNPNEAAQIDWSAPWLAHLAPRFAQRSPEQWAAAADLKVALNTAVNDLRAQSLPMLTGQGKALHFIAQEDLPEGTAYEEHIAETGGVPTRLNLHDFFNASIWLTFPRTKAVLNKRQYEQISANGVTHQRGMARDALNYAQSTALFLQQAGAMEEAQKHWLAFVQQLPADAQQVLARTVSKLGWVRFLPRSKRLGRDTLRVLAAYDLLASTH